MDKTLSIVRDDAIIWAALNRPAVGNALNQSLAEEFREMVFAAERNAETKVIVLSSAAKLFCAGGDVAEISGASDPAAYLRRLAETVHEALAVLEKSRLVTIAVVDGAAAGAGLGLVVNADLVLSGPKSSFLSAYAGVGLNPDCGVSRKLPEIIGRRRAMELTLTGRVLTSKEALDWGLVNEVLPDTESLWVRTRELARHIGTAGNEAYGLTRQLIASQSTLYDQHLNDEVDGLMETIAQEDTLNRMNTFLTKNQNETTS